MIIGIDIDDTIAQTIEITDIYAKEFTENVLKRKFEITKEPIYDSMWARHTYRWSDEEDMQFWNLYYEMVMENVKPKENAVEMINKLYQNNEIIIITARWNNKKGTTNEITKKWLEEYGICYNKIFFGHKDKGEIVQENNIDLFIDDSIKNCKEIASLGIKTFIMNTRINANFDEGNEIIRVYDWNDIYEKIEEM